MLQKKKKSVLSTGYPSKAQGPARDRLHKARLRKLLFRTSPSKARSVLHMPTSISTSWWGRDKRYLVFIFDVVQFTEHGVQANNAP